MSLYKDQRQLIKLSQQCWDCLAIIQAVSYAHAYTFFWSGQLKLVQQGIRKIAPDIRGDWLRFTHDGKTVTFSLSDEAIIAYAPKIQEFSSFGAAVTMLGAYEDFVRKVVELSYQSIPSAMQIFKNNHKKHISRKTNSFVKSEVGRGVDFFQEVFNYNPHQSYKPSLECFYQFRNITVHNAGIVDQKLCDALNNPYVIGGKLKVGMRVHWNLSLVLQLAHLLTDMLPNVDPFICSKLGLLQIENQAYWYQDTGA